MIRVSKESIEPGLAASRVIRNASHQTSDHLSHSRTFSTETISSEFQAMSLDTGSSYKDDTNPNIEYGPLLFKSIPWSAAGKRTVTIKLALWWLHMETKKDLSVQEAYPLSNTVGVDEQLQPLTGTASALPLTGSNQNTQRPKDKGKGSGKRAL